MIDVDAAYRSVIDAVVELQSKEGQRRHRDEGIPGLIAVDDRGGIFTNRAMERGISQVATWLRQSRPSSAATHTTAEFNQAVRASFGPALAALDLAEDLDISVERLKAGVSEHLRDKLLGPEGLEFAVGCTLFSREIREPIAIGPVLFEHPQHWLSRKLSVGGITGVTHRRLTRALDGGRLRRRRPSADSVAEHAAGTVILEHPLVCTVQTRGLARRAAETRGLTAARMAITSIAMLWDTPSRALQGMHLSSDAGPRRVTLLASTPDGTPLGNYSWKGQPSGTYLEIDEWERLLQNNSDYFGLVGRLLGDWVSAGAYERASGIAQSLSQALYFFWQACRDEDDLMAIIKFTAVLEALAGGKKEYIAQLVERRIGIHRTGSFARGKTTGQILDEIYGRARSQTLHGQNEDLAYDWSQTRQAAEWLARRSFVGCVDWHLRNLDETDRSQLRLAP